MSYAPLNTAYENLLKPKSNLMHIYPKFCVHCKSSKHISIYTYDGNKNNYCSKCKQWSNLEKYYRGV